MIDFDKPVRVFRNWKHGCYSIMQGATALVSARQVSLADVEFRVRESGRQRMLRERRKNVHAYAVGRLVDYVHPSEAREIAGMAGRGIIYDPYRFASFVDGETESPVHCANQVRFDESGVVYSRYNARHAELPRCA